MEVLIYQMAISSPYGGALVSRVLSPRKKEEFLSGSPAMFKIQPAIDEIYDAEKICIGAYSPLEGFMGREAFEKVSTENRLPNGLPWTMPIIFAPAGKKNEQVISKIKESDEALILDYSGRAFALLHVEEKFGLDKKGFARNVYATEDSAHPNVADIYALGDVALSGKLDLIEKLDLPAGRFELTPEETRAIFKEKGWNSVAAYQGRNPPHTAHEYLQRVTLERDDIDGLFIQPVVGKLKKGDYKPEIVLKAYEACVNNYYPKERFVLASLSISMRYGGPKAVLFYAIVRRNYGCTHYIVGRDQAGVGNYYDPYAAHKIFDQFDVGIIPLKYVETFYCRVCGVMASSKTCAHPETDHVSTSQTRIRKILSEGGDLPKEILRPEVVRILSQGDVLIT